MTPLRWKILAGYALVALVTFVLWDDLAHGWAVLVGAMTPLTTMLTALLALKFGVVFASLGTFLIVFLEGLLGLIIAVSKIGVIKGLFMPWLLGGLKWLHLRSTRLQRWVRIALEKGTAQLRRVYGWWKEKHWLDKILLLGFVAPLLFIVFFAVLLKRIVYVFISKKAVEQLVQKSTQAVVRNFHRLPLIGGLPVAIRSRVKALNEARDRKLKAIEEDKPQPDPVD